MHFSVFSLLTASSLPVLKRWDPSATGGIQDGGGTWSVSNDNWTSDGGTTRTVWSSGWRAQFGGGVSGTAGSVTPSGNMTVDEIISNTPFSGTYTIAGGSGSLVFTGRSRVTCNYPITITAPITAASGLNKYGTSTLTIGSGGATGLTTFRVYEGPVTMNGGTFFTAVSRLQTENVSGVAVSITASTTIGSLHGGGSTGGNIALGANTMTYGNSSTDGSFGGILSGSGTLTKAGSGTQTFTGADTHTGIMSFGAGTVNFNGTASGVHTNMYHGGTSVINISGVLNAFEWYGNFNYSGAQPTVNIKNGGVFTVSSTGLMGQNDGTSTFTCTIESGGTLASTGADFRIANSGGNAQRTNFTIDSGGTFSLNSSGTPLVVGNSTGLPTVYHSGLVTSARNIQGQNVFSIWNFNGGTLRSGFSSTGFFQSMGRCNIRNSGAIIDTNGFNITIAQPLLHSNIGGDNAVDGGVSKISSGALILSGTNSYNGPTVISGGSLSVSTLANGGVNSNIGASTSAASNLVLTGASFGYTGATVSTDRGFTSSGASNFVVNGSGTLTMTGPIVITAGTLDLWPATALTLTGGASGAGNVEIKDVAKLTLDGVWSNTGTFFSSGFVGGVDIEFNGSITASSGVNFISGDLRGTGTINAPFTWSVDLRGGSTASPTGTLTFGGTITTTLSPRLMITTNGTSTVSQIVQTLASQVVDVTGVVVSCAGQNLNAGTYTVMTLDSGSTFTGTGAMGTHIKPDNRASISVAAVGNILQIIVV